MAALLFAAASQAIPKMIDPGHHKGRQEALRRQRKRPQRGGAEAVLWECHGGNDTTQERLKAQTVPSPNDPVFAGYR